MSTASIRMPGSRRALIVVAAAAIAAAAGALYMSRPAANAAPAATPGAQEIVARGRIEPLGRVMAINGPADTPVTVVHKLLVDQGSKVKAGEVLALLDGYDVRSTDLAVQRDSLKLAEFQLAQVKAGAKSAEIAAQASTLTARQALLEQTQRQWERGTTLFRNGFVSKEALDTMVSNRDQARSGVAQAEDVLKSLTEVRKADENVALAQVKVARAAVARAEAALERLIVRAPVSGTVLSIQTRTGEAITADGILRMADLSQLIVVAEIDESQAGRIANGGAAKIEGSMLPQPVQAKVSRIAHEVFRQKRPASDILIGRDARIVEVELTPQTPLPFVVGGEVTVHLAPKG